MSSRPQILLPVSHWFIGLSVFFAFLLNLLPWGNINWAPDFLAVVLCFWSIHQNRLVGMGAAFFMGVLNDVGYAGVMGEHALAYVLLSYMGIMIHRRVLWFSLSVQMIHVFPLLFLARMVPFLIHWILIKELPASFSYLVGACADALLWPIASLILLAPQRRVINKDDTRPI